jgi:hypothetical protein
MSNDYTEKQKAFRQGEVLMKSIYEFFDTITKAGTKWVASNREKEQAKTQAKEIAKSKSKVNPLIGAARLDYQSKKQKELNKALGN